MDKDMDHEFTGVRIEGGIQPFQIIQQNSEGTGVIDLFGTWRHPENCGVVQLRIVREDDGILVAPWQDAIEQDNAQWRHRFNRVPAGGLYRIESRLVLTPYLEWNPSGDSVHHVGVGDLWVVAGQSNAAGYGRGPVYDPPRLGVHVLRNDERWDVATHVLNEFSSRSNHPNLEKTSLGHSPYLAFGRKLHDTLGYPIGLLQTARGSSTLNQWNPRENPESLLWKNLIHCIRLAGGRVRGMVWYQGESDASKAYAATYERRFADFIHSLRSESDSPDLAVIVTQLNRCRNPDVVPDAPFWSMIREAQRRAASLPRVAVVPTLDLALCDPVHNSSEANIVLGLRSAQAALGLIGRGQVAWRAIEIAEARLSTDRLTIEVVFDHVPTRLDFIAPSPSEFRADDAIGEIGIVSLECVKKDAVRLTLLRPAETDARLHLGYGVDPPTFLRDAEHGVPPLAFFEFPVSPS
jgi:hypothetical protein